MTTALRGKLRPVAQQPLAERDRAPARGHASGNDAPASAPLS